MDYQAPHCDSDILHSPGTCWACDLFPEKQMERQAKGINFTGEHCPGKDLCPAEKKRSLGTINKWYGNVPETTEQRDRRHQEESASRTKMIEEIEQWAQDQEYVQRNSLWNRLLRAWEAFWKPA